MCQETIFSLNTLVCLKAAFSVFLDQSHWIVITSKVTVTQKKNRKRQTRGFLHNEWKPRWSVKYAVKNSLLTQNARALWANTYYRNTPTWKWPIFQTTICAVAVAPPRKNYHPVSRLCISILLTVGVCRPQNWFALRLFQLHTRRTNDTQVHL